MGKCLSWLCAVIVLSFSVTLAATPANDDFANRIPITGYSLTLSATNGGASKQSGEPNHAGNSGGASVWWSWTATNTGPVKLFTYGSSIGTLLAVYTGTSVDSLSVVASNSISSDGLLYNGYPKSSFLTFNATNGVTYRIAVDGANGGTGNITLRLFPDNDNFASRTVLTGLCTRSTNWNFGATKETGEQDYLTDDSVINISAKSLWWSWTAPSNKTVKITTYGSGLDTVLTVYIASSTNPTPASLTPVRSNNDDPVQGGNSSYVTLNVTAGQTYYVNVDGVDVSGEGFVDAGEILLTLTVDNDSWAQRIALTGTNIAVRGTNLRATKQTGEPIHWDPNGDEQGGPSVWWMWTAPQSGVVSISTAGSDFDTLLAVYTNSSSLFSSFRLIAGNDDDPADTSGDGHSFVQFIAPAGVTYQIAVDGNSSVVGNVDLNLTLVPANIPPTLGGIGDRTINEDAAPQSISLTGIGPGAMDETSQSLTVTAFTIDTEILQPPVVNYTNGNTTGSLVFAPVTNANGTAIITVVVTDSGGTANGGVDSITNTFTVVVNPVNDAPTIDPIANVTLLEDSGPQSIGLTGITAGGDDAEQGSQFVTITAFSSNAAIVPNPTIDYNPGDLEGTLSFTSVTNANGTVTISVVLVDDGGTASGGKNSFTNTFTITVQPINDPPVFNALTNVTVLEDSGQRTVNLTGISSGAANESQLLTWNATASDTSLITNVTVTYTSPATTGTLKFTPGTNANGTAIITLVLTDDGGTADGGVDSLTNTFVVTVLPVNDRPTLGAVANRTILEDAGLQTIILTNVASGPANESGQVLTLTALSSNPSLLPNPSVAYTASDTTATLSFATVADSNGVATVSIVVSDDGGAANGGTNAVTNTFTVTVTAVNDPPVFTGLADLTLLEDAGQQTVSLTGIFAGPTNESQTLTFTATTSNPTLITNLAFTYTSPATTGMLKFNSATNASGTVTVSVVLKDNGGTANGGVDSVTNTFVVTVLSVNDRPTLAAIANRTVNDDVSPQTVNLTGIGPGPSNEAGQTLTITATSGDTAVVLTPTVNYTNGATTGTLVFSLATNATGTAFITVIITDDGGTANGGINSTTNTFIVAINYVNDAPTIASTANLTILEDGGLQNISLSGITAGSSPFEQSSQMVTITATSSSTAIVPHPAVSYNNPDATGVLSFTPATNASGTVTITVLVTDNGGTASGGKNSATNTFTITVLPVNDPPVFTALADLTVLEDSGLRSVSLTGISSGAANESQTLSFSATSSDPTLIPNPTFTYTSAAATGTLKFTPVANANGTATITVVLADTGGTTNGGMDSFTNTFVVTVQAVNDRPTLGTIGSRTILEDAGPQTLTLTNLTAGAANESNQILTVIAQSGNIGLLPSPSVAYTPGDTTAVLSFSTVADSNGVATVSVIVSDDGDTTNGGINAVTNTFTVTVTAVNDPPVLNPIANLTLNENAGLQTLLLDGIAPGPPNESAQTITFTFTSLNTGIIPAPPAVTFTNGNSTALLRFTPVTNVTGTATLRVVMTDNGGTNNSGVNSLTNTFLVSILLSDAARTLSLTPTTNGSNVVISWSGAAQGFSLQATTNAAVWSNVTNNPVLVGGRYTVTNSLAGTNRFYRLFKP